MSPHFASAETTIIILSFLLLYTIVIVRKAVKAKLDIGDLLLLCSLAFILGGFLLFPSLAVRLSQLVGVQFPFLLLFGALILVIFIILFRLTRSLQDQRLQIIKLAQHLAIVELSINLSKSAPTPHEK